MDRNCYCGLWRTHPDFLRGQGIPEGFCGTCERCGRPGHTRHFPGPVPYTGAWCDRCHRIVPWLHPARWVQVAIAAGVLLLLAWTLARRA